MREPSNAAVERRQSSLLRRCWYAMYLQSSTIWAQGNDQKMADVVTSENLAEFNRSRLRLNTPVPAPEAEGDKKVQSPEVPRGTDDGKAKENKEEHGEHRKNEFGQRLSDLANARK